MEKRKYAHTSLFLLDVSVPTLPCFSISIVLAPSLACSCLAIANPTTPPPMIACVKSACNLEVVEKNRGDRDGDDDLNRERHSIGARDGSIFQGCIGRT